MLGVYESWGRIPRVSQRAVCLRARPDDLRDVVPSEDTLLPYGNGRSYGDSCLNPAGIVLDTRRMDRFQAFDADAGVLRCDAGVLLADILETLGPRGWFPCVTPGTKHVTVGGCIANDVHGKNHHRHGSFGDHVEGFDLLRSDGTRLRCSPSENADWFAATIGGLGLTGLITTAEIRLRRVPGLRIDEESIRFHDLDAFFALSEESDARCEYTVAWIDCLARGRSLGRGLFMRGNHAVGSRLEGASRAAVPFTPPISLVQTPLLRLFNAAYYRKQRGDVARRVVDYDGFFYPLDGIGHWNRIYGPRGFYQYQCVVPPEAGREGIGEILARVGEAGTGSFLAVLKAFGDRASRGLLSFPRPGVTLALDFPNRGPRTERLLQRLDEVVMGAGGALYPAKDARMPPEVFLASFPRWAAFEPFIDPRFESAFLRRIRGNRP